MRRAEHFVKFLERFLGYLKEQMNVDQVVTISPAGFLAKVQERLNIEGQWVFSCIVKASQ